MFVLRESEAGRAAAGTVTSSWSATCLAAAILAAVWSAPAGALSPEPAVSPASVAAEEGQDPPAEAAPKENAVEEPEAATPVQGAERAREPLAGPSSVQGQIRQDEGQRKFEGLQAAKRRLAERTGLNLGVDYNLLAHQVSESQGPHEALGSALRFYGHWDLVGRNDPGNTGSLVFKVEHRTALGTELPPQTLLPSAGVAAVSGPTFGDNGGMLTNLYWTQALADNRFAFNIGVVDPTDYLDVYALVNAWTDFNNLAFSTNPTMFLPNQGLGAVARWMFTDKLYAVGGFADANSDPHRPDEFFDSFGEGEYFYHLELGWIGSWAQRYSDNTHLTLWSVDDREAVGMEGGWGATVSWSRVYGGKWIPFLRGGWSDSGGTLLDRSVSAGFGYAVDDQDTFFGFGATWGQAPESTAGGERRDQYLFETYYRTHIVGSVSIVPSVQYVSDPAWNPELSNLWLLALRLRAVW